MSEQKNKFHLSEKFVPLLLLIFSIAAYVPLISQLGFFWDDWPMLWVKVTRGAQGFMETFQSDRPFLGFLYKLTAEGLSNDPLHWQILTVFFRWAVTLAFWWAVRQLWPERKREVLWISLLLAVYPGFKQMPITYVWMNAFVMLLAYILSYGMMLKAIGSGTKKGWILWTVPSVLLFTFCTISTEYYTGLEICRFVFIWIFLLRKTSFRESSFFKKVWKTLLQWLPYLVVLGLFMFWRVFIFQFPSYQPVLLDEFAASPQETVSAIGVRAVEDAYTATWGAWTEFFRFPNHVDYTTASGRYFWIAVTGSLAAFLLTAFLYRPGREENEFSESLRGWCVTAMILGAFMVILPGFPYWVTSLPIRLSYPYDRFLVAFMFGSSIFMVGLVTFFIRTRWQRSLIFSLFAAMAVGAHILNANSFRRDWNMQWDFISQLQTRIPSLKQPTILLADDNPMAYESDNSLTGMVNLALAPDQQGDYLPYDVQLFTPRFGTLQNYRSHDMIFQEFRNAIFAAKNDEAIVYHYSPPGCLRILDPEQHSDLNIFPDTYKNFMHISDPVGRIDPDGEASPFLRNEVFKRPVEKNWCYYFQKADLARQKEDWETIAAIGDEVLPVMKAGEASEYFVYTEAYFRLSRWEDAMNTFKRIHAEDKGLDAVLCGYLHKWIRANKPEDMDVILPLITAMNSVGCSMSED